jgi:hypothetical protein
MLASHIRKRKSPSAEREVLRSVIYECDAFINWAYWSRPHERSRRSVIQMLKIVRKVALGGLRRGHR